MSEICLCRSALPCAKIALKSASALWNFYRSITSNYRQIWYPNVKGLTIRINWFILFILVFRMTRLLFSLFWLIPCISDRNLIIFNSKLTLVWR